MRERLAQLNRQLMDAKGVQRNAIRNAIIVLELAIVAAES